MAGRVLTRSGVRCARQAPKQTKPEEPTPEAPTAEGGGSLVQPPLGHTLMAALLDLSFAPKLTVLLTKVPKPALRRDGPASQQDF